MADPRFSHPDFETREEDWPDPDIGSDTEEGRESMRTAEAALVASIDRSISRRNRQPTYPAIPQALYDKARDHQDQLTDEERRLLLSRGDLVGKVLASPDSLTADEIHECLVWPPPDVVRANIQRATGGTLSTPAELYAKAKDAIDRGQLETILCEDEISLPARQFHTMDTYMNSRGEIMAASHVPGRGQAASLLFRRLGLDTAVLQACCIHVMDQQRKKSIWDTINTWKTFNTPRPAEEVIQQMTHRIKDHERGTLSDQEVVAVNWAYLELLQAAAICRSVPSAPVEQMIRSMKSLREQHFLGNITDQEAMIRTGEYLASFQAASVLLARAPFQVQLGNITDQEAYLASVGAASHGPIAPASVPSAPAPIPAAAAATPSQSDRHGSGPWPPTSVPQTPIRVFASATNLSGGSVVPAWLHLSEDQREAYRAQYETRAEPAASMAGQFSNPGGPERKAAWANGEATDDNWAEGVVR